LSTLTNSILFQTTNNSTTPSSSRWAQQKGNSSVQALLGVLTASSTKYSTILTTQIAELNIEHYELTKEGKIRLSHPLGSHNDRFWALELATYASRTTPAPKLWIIKRN